jgi:DNA-directed RNA polymerase specialized sigma24 family protein
MEEDGAAPSRKPTSDEMQSVQAAARNGARTVTSSIQIWADAAEIAVHRWGRKLLDGRTIEHPSRWAFIVGRNAAVSLIRRRTHRPLQSGHVLEPTTARTSREGACPSTISLEQAIDAAAAKLTPRMRQVVHALCARGLSTHEAARELGMDRTNLRRCFHRALARLARANGRG